MRPASFRSLRERGFTLIELLVVIAIRRSVSEKLPAAGFQGPDGDVVLG